MIPRSACSSGSLAFATPAQRRLTPAEGDERPGQAASRQRRGSSFHVHSFGGRLRIISLGHSLKLKVIAEGVEEDSQLEFLKANRCDEAQGLLFAKPMPPEEFGLLLAAAKRQNKK
jgi:hypothetical protein